MNASTQTKTRWFWPWQDNKEEAWLESMAREGWHLSGVNLPCTYSFTAGKPQRVTYRLDFMPAPKSQWDEYRQIFQDAGWEYIGEMSSWRYWRKSTGVGEPPEIFSDNESKIQKYRRLMGYLAIFLGMLIYLGSILAKSRTGLETGQAWIISTIYLLGMVLYILLIGIYLFVVVKLFLRIRQLRKEKF